MASCTGSGRWPASRRCRCGRCVTTTTWGCCTRCGSIPTPATGGARPDGFATSCTGSLRPASRCPAPARSQNCWATTSRSSSCEDPAASPREAHDRMPTKPTVLQEWKHAATAGGGRHGRLRGDREGLDPIRLVTASDAVADPSAIGDALRALHPRLHAALGVCQRRVSRAVVRAQRGHRRRSARHFACHSAALPVPAWASRSPTMVSRPWTSPQCPVPRPRWCAAPPPRVLPGGIPSAAGLGGTYRRADDRLGARALPRL